MTEITNDANASQQDDSASIGTFGSPEAAAAKIREDAASEAVEQPDDKNILDADQTAETDETATSEEEVVDTAESEDEEVELPEASEDDTPLQKKLRKMLESSNRELKEASAKLTALEAKEAPKLTESELFDDLKSFDMETGEPTAKPFVDKLFTNDRDTLERLFDDIALKDSGNGWTFGHHFLKQNGIDPTRLTEVRDYLSGKIGTDIEGVVPPEVPSEYRGAFKSVSQGLRDTIIENLEMAGDGDDAESKRFRQAAMESLQNAQYRLETTQAKEREAQQAQVNFANEIQNEVFTKEQETYTNMFDTLEKGEAFKLTVSSDPLIDAGIKNSVIAQMTALADPDTVMGKRAVGFFKSAGVTVDTAKIGQLMKTVEDNLQVEAVASRRGFKANAESASGKVIEAQAQMIAMANKYFVQYAKAITGQAAKASETEAKDLAKNSGLPNVTGTGASSEGAPQRLSLEQRARAMAQVNRQLAQE